MARDDVVLAETAEPRARAQVAALPRLVETALAAAGLRIGDVEGLAISIGPGSFTGLRIGLGLAKGIAFAGGLPLAAVPTLEALAEAAGAAPGETVCAALDARRREVYAAVFQVAPDGALRRLEPDHAAAPDALAARLPPGTILVGDAGEVYADAFTTATIRPFATHHPRGGIVARLGARRLAAGETVDVGTVEPVYVRPPEAVVRGRGTLEDAAGPPNTPPLAPGPRRGQHEPGAR